jgi:adenylosuccinate synthase
MPIAVIVGGQFGSEGKGKTTAYLCRDRGFEVAVRCGGPNSGHTVTIDGERTVLRQVPAGVVRNNTRLFLAAGCLIDLAVLSEEIKRFSLTPSRLKVDRNAAIIEDDFEDEERSLCLNNLVGSTCTGTGVAVARRALRTRNLKLARDLPELAPYISNISDEIAKCQTRGEKVVVEGTQGFGLSVYHSPYYPYATSRDTTAAGFLSEVGISPFSVTEIIMVIRTFPIRVGGNSGPLPKEIDWATVQRESGYPFEIQEHTSVTNRLRRVARFDAAIVRSAIQANMPTQLALMGSDYLDYGNRSIKRYDDLVPETKQFISWLEYELGTRIQLVGTGPSDNEFIDRMKQPCPGVNAVEEQGRRRREEKIASLP